MMQSDNRNLKSSILSMILLAGTIFILDQLTKSLIVREFYLGQRSDIMSFFNLVHVRNYGAAFSFLSDAGGWQRWFFIIFSITVICLIIYLLIKENFSEYMPFSFVLAGALGNLYDRIYYGYVIDFFEFYYKDFS